MKQKSSLCCLHLGSNMGNRLQYIKLAKELISSKIGIISSVSRLYETAAWGIENQPDFLNQAIQVETKLGPQEVLDSIHRIENDLDRVRNKKWASRTIDIDILFYNNQIVQTANLTIPHPFLHQRNFVLIPLLDISPMFQHPLLLQSIEELYSICADKQEVWEFLSKEL